MYILYKYSEKGLNALLTYKNNSKVRTEIASIASMRKQYFKFFEIALPYIKSEEILDALFYNISQAYTITESIIKKYLDLAFEKGASKYEIKKYYDKFINKYYIEDQYREMDREDKLEYNKNMKIVKNYMKTMKPEQDKLLSLIREKLNSNNYSEEALYKVLEILI